MRPTPAIIAAAADWAVELDSTEIAPARREACETWRRQDPRHRLALDRMLALDGSLARLDGAGRAALQKVLTRRKPSGRRAGAAGLGLALLVAAGVLAAQSFAVRERFADYRTAIGEVRRVQLADGSRLDLDTGAAVDFEARGGKRRVTLYRGQLLAHVAPGRIAPFVVQTRHATTTALGTAYLVRDEGRSTLVTVVESVVRLCAREMPSRCLTLRTGERGRVRDGRVERLTTMNPQSAAGWVGGWLEADDRPVAEVIAELNRYRTRPAAFDAAALSGVKVTGAYPLGDTDRALRSLAQSAGLELSWQPDGGLRIAR